MSSQPRNRRLGPDFFIVGAPKCGTTSMHNHLAAHPEVFMARKEQHFFGADLDGTWRRPTAEQYFDRFAGSGGAARRGDASVWYLRSRSAAREIHAYDPAAQIIVMLRNPLEMLPSLHSQALYSGIEDLQDFSEALAAEPERRQGRRLPDGRAKDYWKLLYTEAARFDSQLGRYIETFGRSQVHVILFDDFSADPAGSYRRVLEFLAVDPGFTPPLRHVNANKRIRSSHLRHATIALQDPSSRLRRTTTRLIPVHPVRSYLLRTGVPALKRLNTTVAPRPPIDPRVRAELAEELAPTIRRLGDLLGRDLSHWYSGFQTAAA